MDANKLKYYIAARGKTLADVETALKIGKATLYRKINGKTEFTLLELRRIIILLGLSVDEIMEIFFADLVSKRKRVV